MEETDLKAGLALCRAAGWNQLEEDWRFFLRHGACLVAGEPVFGTAASLEYEGRFHWIGMVLVDPAHRRHGIGTRLLEGALELHSSTARLDATPAGYEVYRKLGFEEECRLVRMQSPGLSGFISRARPMTAEDFAWVGRMDAAVFGADRAPLLRWLFLHAPEYAYVIEGEAYCLGRPGHTFAHIGPLIANDDATARELLLAASPQEPFIVDCPLTWQAALEQTGLRVQRPFIRMFCGAKTWVEDTGRCFAIAGPEFG